MDLLRRTVFFSKGAIIKAKSATIAFFLLFLCFSLFLFLLFFSFVTVILELLGIRSQPFDAFSLKCLQISIGWFSKNRLDIPVLFH